MTSTTSKCNSNFIPVMRKGFKKLLANIIGLAVLASLGAIGCVISQIETAVYEVSAYHSSSITNNDITQNAIMLSGALTILCGLFSLVSASRLFNEIYSKRACDFYFATPVKRETTFAATYLVGAIVNVVCLVLPSLIFVGAVVSASNQKIKYIIDMQIYIKALIVLVLSLIAIYTAFIMCAVMSGKRLHYAVLSVICLVCPPVISIGIISRINTIWGLFVDFVNSNTLSPVTNSVSALGFDKEINIFINILIPVIEIIAMFIAGLYIFKGRRAEVAEVSVAGRIMPYVMLSIVVLSGFMAVECDLGVAITIIGGVIIAVVVCILFSLIFFKKAFTKSSAATAGIVCAVATLFVVLVFVPKYDSYVKYVPSADEIESVKINNVYYNNMSSTILNAINSDYTDYGNYIELKEKEGIENAVSLHKKLVDDDTIKLSKKNYLNTNILKSPYRYDSYVETTDLQLVYTLKNGRTVKRTYTGVVANKIMQEGITLMRDDEALRQISPFNLENIKLASCSVYNEEYDLISRKIIPADKCDELLEIYLKDKQELDSNTFAQSMGGFIGFCYDHTSRSSQESYTDIEFLYYDSEDTPEDVKKQIDEKAPDELMKIFDRGYYSSVSSEDEAICNYLMAYNDGVYPSQEKTLNFIDSIK